MSIIIDINAEAQAALAREAMARGVPLESYAATLLEEAAQESVTAKSLREPQLTRTLQELEQFSHKIPLLPDEAFSREGLYQDPD